MRNYNQELSSNPKDTKQIGRGRLLLSNWVHLFGFFFTLLLTSVVLSISNNEAQSLSLTDHLFGALYSLFYYGSIFLGGFVAFQVVTDLILVYLLKIRIRLAFILEWILLAVPFAYYSFHYDYPFWRFLLISFALTQFLRYRFLKGWRRKTV